MSMQVGYHRAGVGAQFALKGVWISFEGEKISVWTENLVFVDGACSDFGKKEFPDAGGAAGAHGMDATVPMVHVTDDADAPRGWRPDGEVSSGHAGDGLRMRTEFFVGVEVAAFAH